MGRRKIEIQPITVRAAFRLVIIVACSVLLVDISDLLLIIPLLFQS